MLKRLAFSDATAGYLTRKCGIDSLQEVSYLDGKDAVKNTIKGDTIPGRTLTLGNGSLAVSSHNNGIPVLIRAVANLKLCVYYWKYME
jgi:hypothetical protein